MDCACLVPLKNLMKRMKSLVRIITRKMKRRAQKVQKKNLNLRRKINSVLDASKVPLYGRMVKVQCASKVPFPDRVTVNVHCAYKVPFTEFFFIVYISV